MAQYDFIVIGSGVSGMTFAQNIAEKGKKVLVMEASDRTGGSLSTMHHDDFWLEMGGHTIYSSYASYINNMKRVNIVSRFLPRVKQPFKMLTDRGLLPITKVLNKTELMMNGVKLFFTKKEGKTVREYYSSFLGKGNYETMFRPMIQAVISQEGSDFPADMMLKKRPKDKSMPRSFTIFGGMNYFIRKAADNENITVKTSCGAKHISVENGIYTVTSENGEVFSAENVTLACAPSIAGKLLSETSEELSALLRQIPSAKVETMGIIINKEDIKLDTLSFIVAQDAAFTSVVSRDVVRDEKYRGFAIHFKPDRLTYEQKLEAAENILGVSKHAFVKTETVTHLSPTLGRGHDDIVKLIDKKLKDAKGIYITGNYFGGLAIEDCAVRSRSEADRAL
ncbi:MAG: NAD(P)/FAD-dependent oxidoreductase [Deferribacterales bacterium]